MAKKATTAPGSAEGRQLDLEELRKDWDPNTFTLTHLENIIKQLMLDKPFFGYTLNRIDRYLDDKLPAPGALDIQTLKIMVNPILFSQFTDKEKVAIMEHEVLHYAFKHPQRFRSFYESVIANKDWKLSRRLNIAMDAAINQLIPDIPEGCVTLKWIEDMVDYIFKHKPEAYNNVKPKVEEKKSSEYYFKLINHEVEDPNAPPCPHMGNESAGDGEEHAHVFNGPGSEMNEKEMENIIENAKERQRAEDKKAGTGAGSSILDLLPSDIPVVHDKIWRNLVEKAFGETLQSQKEVCFGRPSRRREDSNWYGRRLTRSNTVYVGLDTSASVGDDELADFLGYINRGMKKYDTEVVLIQCDWDVEHVKRLRRLSKSDMGVKIHGRGGTDMTKILDWIEENEKDPRNARLILLTDGWTPWRESKVRTTVVYTPNHAEMTPAPDAWAVMHEKDVFNP